MNLNNYIKGKNTPLYLILRSGNYYLSTDNFKRLFYFKGNELIKVENSEIVEELYNNVIYLENHKDDLEVKATIRKNRIYNNFWSFVSSESSKRR